MTVADTVVVYCMFLLIPISIVLGTINLINFYHFYKQREIRFLQTRKPRLIIIYCIIASISSILTLPYISFAHIMCNNEASSIWWINNNIELESRWINNIISIKWIIEFIHEISTCFLIEIIAIRSWCLYYDYKVAIARTERIWRLHINSSESNIWIDYSQYIGNYKFILYSVSILSFFALSLIIILHIIIDFDLYGFMADFTVSIPISIFILWLHLKIKDTADQYMIKHELKRLSVCVAIIIFSFIIWIIKQQWIHHFDIHLLMYTADIIFVFFTVYFQTKWVIQQSNIHRIKYQRRLKFQHCSHSSLNNSPSNTKELGMVDVLRSKNGFKAFINHCVGELNVEGLLFLVEVSQLKATLNEYHVGEGLIESYNINVIDENLPRMILKAKQEREEEVGTISRGSSLRKRVSAMVKGMGISTENIKIAPNQSIAVSSKQSSNGSPISLQLNNYSSGSVLKTKRSNTLREDTFKRFQQDILSRDWLPISRTLKPEENEMITPPPSNHGTPKINSIPNTNNEKLGHLSIGQPHHSPKSMINNNNHTTIDTKWIFEFSQYLCTKYINSSSQLCINLSGNTRHDLLRLFQLNQDSAFHFIRNVHFDELTEEEKEIIINDTDYDSTLIKTFLYHSFDVAFNEIWALLRDDVFLRFQLTEQYQQLKLLNREKLNKSSNSTKILKQRTSSNSQKIQTPTITANIESSLGNIEMSADQITSNNRKSQTLINIYTPSQKPIEIQMTMKYNSYSHELDEDYDADMDGFEILEPDTINALNI